MDMDTDLFTVDKTDPHRRVLLWHNAHETLSPVLGVGTRFRLVLIENGNGILHLGTRREPFIAPALFCLNEMEQPELEQSRDLRAQALYFHPNVVNSAFTFASLRQDAHAFSLTESQDRYWLTPFVQRRPDYGGHLHLGPIAAQRASALFNAVSQILSHQQDPHWMCQSRAFFLELLFLAGRTHIAPQAVGKNPLTPSPHDIDAVILYLHTHYANKITITKLARTFHTNRTTLTQQFRQATGVSIITYLTRLRIRLAGQMLRDTTLSIGQIMERVGFNDSSHFGRMFRRYTDCSPTEYRQRYGADRRVLSPPSASIRSWPAQTTQTQCLQPSPASA